MVRSVSRTAKSKHAGGRPTVYKPAFAEQAAKLCDLGATDFELADFFKVNVSTIYRWKTAHKEFCEAVEIGKERANERVETSFYQRALGYDYEAEKVFLHRGKVLRVRVMEHIPADVGAALNWLKNRRPNVWRDKQGPVNQSVSDLSDAELNAEIKALLSI